MIDRFIVAFEAGSVFDEGNERIARAALVVRRTIAVHPDGRLIGGPGLECIDKPRIADPAFAGNENAAAFALARPAPAATQEFEFFLAADQGAVVLGSQRFDTAAVAALALHDPGRDFIAHALDLLRPQRAANEEPTD